MDTDILTILASVLPPGSDDIIAELRERRKNRTPEEIALDYEKRERERQEQRAKEVADYEIANARYLKLDKTAITGIPKILSDRIARLHKEIWKETDFREREAKDPHASKEPDYYYEIALITRVCDLTQWTIDHHRQAILCISTDPSDANSYGLSGVEYSGALSQRFDDRDEEELGFWLQHECRGLVSQFNDPTLWEVAAGLMGNDRYYIAFQKKTDAAFFRLRWL